MIVNTIGPPDATIMLVGEAPGEQEDRTGKPFEGSSPTGRTLNKILEAAGISRHECLITNVAKERPPGNKIQFYFTDSKCTNPKPVLVQWIQSLKEEIEFYHPNIIVALGKIATQTLIGDVDLITATRGYIYNSTLIPGQKVLSTFHPQKVNYEWKLFFTAVMDMRKAVKNSTTPELPVDDRVLVTNFSKTEYIEYLKYLLYEHSDPIAVDIETCQPGSHVHTIGLADSPKHAVSFSFLKGRTPCFSEFKELEIWQYLAQVLTTKELIMQNGSYDTGVLYYNNGIYCPRYFYDTLIAAHICWPEAPRSLQYLASICLNVPAWKNTNESTPLLYNASDAANTYGVWNVLEAELERQNNFNIYKHEMVQVEPSVMLQLQGLKVDTKVQKKLLEEIDIELEEVKDRLSKALNREVIFKADKTKKDAININSSQQLANLLYIDLGIKEQYKRRKSASDDRKVTTDEETLSKLARTIDNPVFTDIIKVKKLSKLKTFINIELSPEDKVYTSYNVTGATMAVEKKGFVIDEEDSFKSFGRWSSSKSIILPFGNGNLQNVPKQARKMYTAPEGFEIIQADYIQAEAVVVAYEIGDSRTISLFQESFGLSREEKKVKNYDVHKLSASAMFGLSIDEITPEMRTIGKVIKHATNYDAGPAVLAHKLQTTMKNAKELLQKSYAATPQLKLWHKRIEQSLQKSRVLTNLFGRKHRFLGMWNESLLRSAYSFIPQSTVGDLLNKSLVTFYRKYGEIRSIILQLHDAIYILSPLEKRDRSISMLKNCMLHELTSTYGDKYIIDVDFSVGKSWGEMEEL